MRLVEHVAGEVLQQRPDGLGLFRRAARAAARRRGTPRPSRRSCGGPCSSPAPGAGCPRVPTACRRSRWPPAGCAPRRPSGRRCRPAAARATDARTSTGSRPWWRRAKARFLPSLAAPGRMIDSTAVRQSRSRQSVICSRLVMAGDSMWNTPRALPVAIVSQVAASS